MSMSDDTVVFSPLTDADAELRTEPPRGLAAPVTAPASMSVAVPSGATAQSITCPECGTIATVAVTRREAQDFCRQCDYPLFWVPTTVLTGRDSDGNDESLRRLPGTVGRATIASLTCPHCSEPNALTADVCVRCARSLHPVEAPPPEPVVYVPAPEPVVPVEPESRVPWWVWAIAAVVGVLAVALITILILQRLT